MPPISLAFFSPSSSWTSKIATLAPAAASADAVAPPKPDAPPVTMAACPLTFIETLLGCAAFSTLPPLAKRPRGTHLFAMSDEQIVQQGFWTKARQTLGRIPFSEDAVAAFHCATDGATPLPVRA